MALELSIDKDKGMYIWFSAEDAKACIGLLVLDFSTREQARQRYQTNETLSSAICTGRGYPRN